MQKYCIPIPLLSCTCHFARLLLGREEVMGSIRANATQANVIAAIEVKGNFMFDPAKHPDFLGAILGTGVVRGKVGDILVQGETGAQIMCDPELIEHFEMALTQVRGCRV